MIPVSEKETNREKDDLSSCHFEKNTSKHVKKEARNLGQRNRRKWKPFALQGEVFCQKLVATYPLLGLCGLCAQGAVAAEGPAELACDVGWLTGEQKNGFKATDSSILIFPPVFQRLLLPSALCGNIICSGALIPISKIGPPSNSAVRC